jgi:molecular chaperone DnaK (HSP70)
MSEITIYSKELESGNNTEITPDKKCFGIDLGTTSTLMCVVDSANVNLKESTQIPIQFLKINQESPFEYNPMIEDEKVASIVGVYNGRPYVGNNLYHLKGHPEFEYRKNLFYHWKTELGIDHEPMYPDAISEKLNMPYKIAGGILNYIRKSRFQDNSLSNVIITVPASFQINQRKDVLNAAKMANIDVSDNMLIDEPNAAFLGYFNRLSGEEKTNWARDVKNKNIIVVDFGGGTLDLSILNIDFKSDKGITISNRAISRYNDLGGQDIDWLIAEEYLLPKLKKVFPSLDVTDLTDIRDVILPQLALIAESLKVGICNKISLSAVDKDVKQIDISKIDFTYNNARIKFRNEEFELGDISLSASDFKSYFSKIFSGRHYEFEYIDKTITTISHSINNILEKAEMKLNEVNYVLFVGGSSFNPFLYSFCCEKLSNSKPLTSHEPDKLVAEGAAVYSYFLNVHNISLINPITSDTIGITLKGKRFYPILEKGVTLPKKVNIPDFKLQTNLNSEVIVPVCMNSNDFIIGEIRAKLNSFYDIDSIVKIEAEVTIDKVFKLNVYIEDELIGNAEFENPFSTGDQSDEEKNITEIKRQFHKAKLSKDYRSEKDSLYKLIRLQFDNKNYPGCLESCEDYIKRFDDTDTWVWNMSHISNKKLGRIEASKRAILKSIEINPFDETLHFNYSIFLSEYEGKEVALDYLENLSDYLKSTNHIRLRILDLKASLGHSIKEQARKIVDEYKTNQNSFTPFLKENLLPQIFSTVGEPYHYNSRSVKRTNNDDDSKYLDTNNNLPF